MSTGSRKDSHIEICLNDEIEYYAPELNGFGAYRFDHDALPEVNKSDIDLSVTLFSKKLKAPLIIGAMTGGTDRAEKINKILAKAAARTGVGFALGSQRILLENDALAKTFAVKEIAPSIPLLFGNVGAVQLNYGMTAKDVKKLCDLVKADAFNFHLNPLQESVQPEGDINFSGLIAKLKDVIPQIGVPVLFKEVGSGISETTAMKIKSLPISGVETAGVGGTSWSKIESYRAASDSAQRNAGELFARWGVPTIESILAVRKTMPETTLIASGGMRNGIEMAKAISLGANACAMALPFLKAAEKSEDAVVEAIERVIEELRVTLFCVGAKNIQELKTKPLRRAQDFTAFTKGSRS